MQIISSHHTMQCHIISYNIISSLFPFNFPNLSPHTLIAALAWLGLFYLFLPCFAVLSFAFLSFPFHCLNMTFKNPRHQLHHPDQILQAITLSLTHSASLSTYCAQLTVRAHSHFCPIRR